MEDNPFQSPVSPAGGEFRPVVGVGSREELREVGNAQRGLLICLLVQIVLYVFLQLSNLGAQAGGLSANPASPDPVRLGLALILFVFGVGGMVYTFRLGKLLSGMGMGILFAILSLLPCLGLLVLLLVNGKATNLLKANGITVGFLGCDPNSS